MDVVTIGETMVLLTPVSIGQMRYTQQFSRSFGGSESNFAICLSRLDHEVGWISRIGNDEFKKGLVIYTDEDVMR
ncbi:PfkB family carbohydrate kinase [Anaerobacillus isosaccharinicus]|uniref:Carbohydrate kinase PfkB domain-containing protein n=1 Tax=Anaerobacillus isosaccharinicus TaxID=1532552 RepID=A0A1S2M316_9BACI|nr:PfkB family carbohydrate kinase [Anaerobacillus isosaccharinicus]MBA5588202.1 hypothetical protein [Anaerobacillus isosaccharinicus]QOY38349.1 hypothetical protein AWH56_012925 [Anaerobacillus isosaccharinicus]